MDESEAFTSADWAAAALEADRVREALLTLLWTARGQVLCAETRDVREAASAVMDVVKGGQASMEAVAGFLARGRERALDEESGKVDSKGAE